MTFSSGIKFSIFIGLETLGFGLHFWVAGLLPYLHSLFLMVVGFGLHFWVAELLPYLHSLFLMVVGFGLHFWVAGFLPYLQVRGIYIIDIFISYKNKMNKNSYIREMELTIEPEQYCLVMDEFGNYMDKTPHKSAFSHGGINCPCKHSVFLTPVLFTQHCKSKTHIKWLESVNNNKHNFMAENIKNEKTIKLQQQLITQMSIESQNLKCTIVNMKQQIQDLHQLMQTLQQRIQLLDTDNGGVVLLDLLD
jgi:hypothetical protein